MIRIEYTRQYLLSPTKNTPSLNEGMVLKWSVSSIVALLYKRCWRNVGYLDEDKMEAKLNFSSENLDSSLKTGLKLSIFRSRFLKLYSFKVLWEII